MAESAYELISSTDGESQDGRMSGSVSSLDYPRPDDVHSLNGSNNEYPTDTDEDAAENTSEASSIRYADQALQSPSTRSTVDALQYRSPSDHPQSIEFLEADVDKDSQVILDKISVKHTIREFTEDETSSIAKDMDMSEAPRRLVATIRQTMSPSCLSTKEPLRILYAGSQAARMDIIYKISSAICASGGAEAGQVSSRSGDGVFNIFPISEFGSTNMPDVHLLESSGRQIRVEDCTSAEEMVIEGDSFPGDTVYSVTVDGDKTYRSLFTPSGSVIQPKWTTLPHIAIFFCTEKDDETVQRTRNFAWEFMSRHGVPSIFISNEQSFTRAPTGRWSDFVDQHAVHLCLESRDRDGPMQSRRLPIDLTSFLNIDARQMNRNLTYLTGLAEPQDLAASEETVLSSEEAKKAREPLTFLCGSRRAVREYLEENQWVITLAMTVFGGLVAMFLAALPQFSQTVSPSSQAPIFSTVTPGLLFTASSAAPTVATTTVIINVTATKTATKIVQIRPTAASASSVASVLSFAGFLSDKASSAAAPAQEEKKTSCSVEIYSSNEILVRVPSGSKATWLAKGAIDIDVYRGDDQLKSKLSSVDEGIIIEVNKKDAYGVLNISVITTRKPKINQTFEVNFGKPAVVEAFEAGMHVLHDMAEKIADTADAAAHLVGDTCMPAMAAAAEKLRDDASSVLDRVVEAGKAAQTYTGQLGERVMAQAKDSLKGDKLNDLLKDAQDQMADRLATAQDLRDDLNLALLKAQIASKLWWLKVQGKDDEHAKYEQQAVRFLKSASDKIARDRDTRHGDSSQENMFSVWGRRKIRQGKTGRCSGRPKTKESRWKKMMAL
jgi:hypothetical protein